MNKPHCDWLTISHDVADTDDLLNAVWDVLLDVRVSCADGDKKRYQFRDGCSSGNGMWYRQGHVGVFSFSGFALTQIRVAGVFDRFLWSLATVPHRVTRLDAALDVSEAPQVVIERLYDRGRSGEIALTRKRVDPSVVSRIIAPAHYPGGSDTGSVYFGKRGRNDVTAKVYDKRQQRMALGYPDDGVDLTRYEVEVHKSDASLRDAYDPERMFWHFMADVLPAPAGVVPWEPTGGGYDLPPRRTLDPAARLRRFVDDNQGVFRRLFALGDATAAAGSPHGRAYALQLVQALGDGSGIALGAAETAEVVSSDPAVTG